jgi:hypothetical protein
MLKLRLLVSGLRLKQLTACAPSRHFAKGQPQNEDADIVEDNQFQNDPDYDDPEFKDESFDVATSGDKFEMNEEFGEATSGFRAPLKPQPMSQATKMALRNRKRIYMGRAKKGDLISGDFVQLEQFCRRKDQRVQPASQSVYLQQTTPAI